MQKHVKPRFTFSGGVYQVQIVTEEGMFAKNAMPVDVWFDATGLRRLFDAYAWWKKRDPEYARITVAMLLRHCDAYRLRTPGKDKGRLVLRDKLHIFIRNPDSRFKTVWLGKEPKRPDGFKGVEEMISVGYCRVSNKGRMVARIDDPNWRYMLALHFTPWDPEEGMSRAYGRDAADYYRRCLSVDKVVVPNDVNFSLFPPSGDGFDDFIPL